MSVIEAFEKVFRSIYSGQKLERDYKIVRDRYFPSDVTRHKKTTSLELERIHGLRSQTCINVYKNHFENPLREFIVSGTENKEIQTLKDELESIYFYISEFGNTISLENLMSFLDEKRSLAGIFDLGDLCGIPRNFHLVHLRGEDYIANGRGYVIPRHITKKQLDKAFKEARKVSQHLGAVYPYDKLDILLSWNFVQKEQQKRFAKELLASGKGFVEIEKDYFGFTERDRLFSQLRKIYSVYNEVPKENITASLYRTIKKRISGQTKISGDGEEKDEVLLEECVDGFDQYCIQMMYYEKKGNYRIAKSKLRNSITQEPYTGKLYKKEKELVGRLRENGKPMFTDDFAPLLKSLKGSTKTHIMEAGDLIYRTGFKYNSTYHTLDDRYETGKGKTETVHQVDRTRIEINRINRSIHLAQKVKRLCEFKCQLCGDRVQIGEDEFYAEAHHIQPLGKPHNGDDVLENMICVCPNCHVKLDYGIVPLEKSKIHFLDEHPIGDIYISYHNETYFPKEK